MLLECQDITYYYPHRETCVLKDLSCRLARPGFHALFGPSGVGKTTLARIIAGVTGDFTGQVVVDEAASILYSYNLERLPGWSSVGDHLREITPSASMNGIAELVDSFGLQGCLNARFAQLSLGQQNRTNLTRYLLQDFDLLVMDESLANVDELTREQIILKIKAMFPQKYFLYISHNVVEIAKFCEQIIVLRSAHKSPQAVTVDGRDFRAGMRLPQAELERTMLEIMNAS